MTLRPKIPPKVQSSATLAASDRHKQESSDDTDDDPDESPSSSPDDDKSEEERDQRNNELNKRSNRLADASTDLYGSSPAYLTRRRNSAITQRRASNTVLRTPARTADPKDDLAIASSDEESEDEKKKKNSASSGESTTPVRTTSTSQPIPIARTPSSSAPNPPDEQWLRAMADPDWMDKPQEYSYGGAGKGKGVSGGPKRV